MKLKEIEELLKKHHWVEIRCGENMFKTIEKTLEDNLFEEEDSTIVSSTAAFFYDMQRRISYITIFDCRLDVQLLPEFDSERYYKVLKSGSSHTLRSTIPQIILPLKGLIIDPYIEEYKRITK